MTARTVNEVRTGTGGLGKVDDAMITSGPAAPVDADNDGMSDSWEIAAGLDPADATDNIKDRDNDGYTNIEEYINCVADSLLGSPCPPPQAVEAGGKILGSRIELSITPNPLSGANAVQIGCAGSTGGVLKVVDASGRTIARFNAESRMTWNGQTRGGHVPAGVYLAQWENGDRIVAQKKLVVLR
jgi:hypothetical protein